MARHMGKHIAGNPTFIVDNMPGAGSMIAANHVVNSSLYSKLPYDPQKDFRPISIQMAKRQNLSLNPSKISGQCGRLLCCLAYEDGEYKNRKNPPASTLPVVEGENGASWPIES